MLICALAVVPVVSAQAPPPEFSHPGGYHSSEFELTISAPEGEVRYTLDGSEPDEASPLFSEALAITSREGDPNVHSEIPTNVGQTPGPPFYVAWQPPAGEVFKITTVRARAFVDGEAGDIASRSFIVDPAGTGRFNLPVISIVTQPENLFDDEIGIYVPGNHPDYNYEQRGRDWEREAHLEFFESDGTPAIAQDIGVRIHGSSSRVYPRKSLRIYARSDYGESWINYPILPHQPVSRYKRLILRNSGQDWGLTVMRDGVLQSLMRGLNAGIRDYRPTIVFINGEYWGIHNIRDRHDDRYLQSHYGMDTDNVILLENNAAYDDGNEAGRQHYLDMIDFAGDNDLSDDAAFDHVETMMDVDSFIDQVIGNSFVMNTDWPGNNIAFWRYVRDGYDPDAQYGYDGRWRWFINDLDYGFLLYPWIPGGADGVAHNTLAFALEAGNTEWPNQDWSTFLFRQLIENEGFQTRLANRYADLLNTRFRSDAVLAAIDGTSALLEPEIEEHIHRWRRPLDLHEWHDNLSVMLDFAEERPDHVFQHIMDVLDLPATVNVSLDVEEVVDASRGGGGDSGSIQINTIQPDLSTVWQGRYFETVPITLIARPAPGYQFVGWTGSAEGTTDTLQVTLSEDVSLTAHFAYTGDFPGDEMNPAPHDLSDGPFEFNYWSPEEPELSFPDHMVFQQTTLSDPGLNDPMAAPYFIAHDDYHANDQDKIGFPYGLTGRTRLTGLEDGGISFINTGRGRDLGAAVAALNTLDMENVSVTWTGGTVQAQSREYRMRLQYRVGIDDNFVDVLNADGTPVEYVRNASPGHARVLGPVTLPDDANDRPYVQLRWKHYFSGTGTSGPRDELRLGDVLVQAQPIGAEPPIEGNTFVLGANYPNPFIGSTTIPFSLEQSAFVTIEVFNVLGQRVAMPAQGSMNAGDHAIEWASTVAAGVYFYRMSARETADGPVRHAETRRMVVH